MGGRSKNTAGQGYHASRVYRKLVTQRADIHPIPRLRALFAVGRSRSTPISQAEFACWCGLSRESILIAEKPEHTISARVAGRIYDLSGADLSWLQGKTPLEDYDYHRLQAWYPDSFPGSAKKIDELASGSAKSFSVTPLQHALSYVAERLGNWSHRRASRPCIPNTILDDLRDQFGTAGYKREVTPLWQAFAFAPNVTAVRTALEWGVLDEVPNGVELPSPGTATNKDLTILAHQLTVALGRVERGEIEV